MLSFLTKERQSQQSYFSYLGLDLLGFINKFFREDRVAFANQELSSQPITWTQHLHYFESLLAINDSYMVYYRNHQFDFCLRDNTVIQSQASAGIQLENYGWNAETKVRLSGHLATYFHQDAQWTFNFLTQTFTSVACDLHQIIDPASTYSGYDVRKGRLLVLRTTAEGKNSLCVVFSNQTWKTILDDLPIHYGYLQSGRGVFVHWSDREFDLFKQMALYQLDTHQLRPITLPTGIFFSPYHISLRGTYLVGQYDTGQRLQILDLWTSQIVSEYTINPNYASVWIYWDQKRLRLFLSQNWTTGISVRTLG